MSKDACAKTPVSLYQIIPDLGLFFILSWGLVFSQNIVSAEIRIITHLMLILLCYIYNTPTVKCVCLYEGRWY